MKRFFNIYLLLIVLFFFTGCAGVREFLGDIADKIAEKNSEKAPEGTKFLPASYYLEKALAYEKNDELQTALFYMQIAGTLNPDSIKIPEKIASLKSTIDHKARKHFTTGVECYEKRKFKDARRQFLTTLRYAPGHQEALDYLKNRLHPKEYLNYTVKEKDTLKDISKKFYKDPSKDFLIAYFNNLKTGEEPISGTTLEIPVLESEFNRPSIDIPIELIKAENLLKEKQYEQALAVAGKILDYDKSNKAAQDLINTAFCQQGKDLIIRKNYTEALHVLSRADPQYDCVKKTTSDVYTAMEKQAEVHYLKGVNHFLNEELQSAIKEWEKTLALNPEHKKAKKNINNARSLLKKLEKVK
ncbi:MAG: hypothetical protein WBB70_00130 [Desulfobacterales bacterium]